MNNKLIEFWNDYNLKTIEAIEKLIVSVEEKGEDFVLVDFHTHSNYSSDGKQSLKELINNAKTNGIKIISITDHDDVRVYNELYNIILKENLKDIIIVTGIEHTTSYPQYGEMCHILKHFINPLDRNVLKDIAKLEKSYFKRAKIQFKRIKQNTVLNQVIKENNIKINYKDFFMYLKNKELRLPDYAPLIDYIADKLKEKNVSTVELFNRLVEDNNLDECEERKNAKAERFKFLIDRYGNTNLEDNRRFILSILAVRGVDDAKYKGFKPSGSLSVNEYGQPSIFKLNKSGVTTFAHPTEKSIEALYNCSNIGGGLVGIEDNLKNIYKHKSSFKKVKKDMGLIEIKGSDGHALKEDVYMDMNRYKMKISELKEYIAKVKEKFDI